MLSDKNKQDLCQKLRLKNLHQYQEEALNCLLRKQDCIVIQPTSTGKSIVYTALPLAKCLSSDGFSGCVICIQPIISLMEDQMTNLKKLGIPYSRLAQKSEKLAVKVVIILMFYTFVLFIEDRYIFIISCSNTNPTVPHTTYNLYY